jgi:hypothetical protein
MRLHEPLFAQVNVNPTGKTIFFVPKAFAMSNKNYFVCIHASILHDNRRFDNKTRIYLKKAGCAFSEGPAEDFEHKIFEDKANSLQRIWRASSERTLHPAFLA